MTESDRDLLRAAAEEIRTLRRRGEILQAKVDTWDMFMQVLNVDPAQQPLMGIAEDIAWKIDVALAGETVDREENGGRHDG